MADDQPFHTPFAALKPMRDAMPETPPPARAPAAAAPARHDRPVPRAVIRLERSGRGGKEVTIIDHLDLRPADRDAWLKALKTALGCGGTVDGDAIVLQGDQRKRLPDLLTARGVRKITVS